MSEHQIPDDLTGRYIELTRWYKGPLDGMQMPLHCSLGEEAALIERIAKLEAERDQLDEHLASWNMAKGMTGVKQLMAHAENLRAQYNREAAENAQLRAALALADTRAINLKAGLGKMADALARMQQTVTRKQIWFDEWRPIINAIGEVSVQEAMDAIERDL